MVRHYGLLHWWPGETPFEVMVGAILTQNTAWSNVEKAIRNLKKSNLLSFKKLYRLPPSKLQKLIKPAGYFRVKTKRLKNFLEFLMKECGGDIKKLKRQSTKILRKKLLNVNGIGPETANSILLYALEKPIFVIDAYTKRILTRHYLIGEPLKKPKATYEELQNLFMSRLKPSVSLYNEYHAQLVHIGKDFCRTKPRCEACPLNGLNW
ncbi:MAG: endonuclease [Deltaproteobacteria bacterium RIFCSPLOWO2_12_FULL_44_12]|nr:MAG: endonuclease [Deltaproteobacteria bacterium RIFCSPHIGHO2_01_FULL_43_49]OGQ16274.1 MAG: endonuclease [Deltaproteobacteria bacterium RIFCSPHIGHO2_02_FULL_44_53]OGQ29234.1 MAG: endonuclease [Deltaproteobacteria bacterium RIFCSPHIGHO2_12_FULL_44_21]OGQ32791.1 MAG: endonuclease [Deltaproteobacteria bacterium RIFCSPLOWO2_01_FULL_45_74]OGQ41892.1 MAG: endonuclease [Deltaproteobacteria bacterium RIFCSPLOWO2_02_FULL_44_34]OGQ71637.1 MAG: endonuclease [Deltaproteobacteria bacterium RIFCSPLOWO2_1